MNTNDEKRPDGERESVEMLLPWYQAGTLDAADAERVAAYLERHPEVSQQLALAREEQDAAVTANEALGAPAAGALDRLMASIEAEAAPDRATAGGALGWLGQLFRAPLPAGLQWAAGAAMVLIVAQAVALGVLLSQPQPGTGFVPATGEETALTGGTFALVLFKQDAGAGAITALLSELEATIVEGPKPDGFYRVRLSSKVLGEAERDALLQRLTGESALVSMAIPAN